MKWFFRKRFSVFEIITIGVCSYLFMGNFMAIFASGLLVRVVSDIIQSALGLDITAKEKKV